MTTFLNPKAIPGVNILIHINGQDFIPSHGYILGVLKAGDKIVIGVEVAEGVDHRCYTIDSKMIATPKAAARLGFYLKGLTVTASDRDGVRSTQIAGWPNNMLCLEIHGKTYNIGLFNRSGKYFFAVVEKTNPIETNSALPVGFVTDFDVLRGVARVFTGSVLQEAKLHWSNMPFRKALGFRAVVAGEVLTLKALVGTGAEKTTFSEEIKACALA